MDKYAEYCGLLGLDTVADTAELKSVYRNAVKRWHPDRYMFDREMQEAAIERIKRINTAYQYVSERLSSSPPKPQPVFPSESLLEVFLKSSQIISTAYDYSAYSLYIKFKSSNVYRFCEVPPRIYDELISSGSPGLYARKHVYRTYKYLRCV
jgi:hypothetical protein